MLYVEPAADVLPNPGFATLVFPNQPNPAYSQGSAFLFPSSRIAGTGGKRRSGFFYYNRHRILANPGCVSRPRVPSLPIPGFAPLVFPNQPNPAYGQGSAFLFPGFAAGGLAATFSARRLMPLLA